MIARSCSFWILLGLTSLEAEEEMQYAVGADPVPKSEPPAAAESSPATMVPEYQVRMRPIYRRTEIVAKADEAALRGQRLMADQDLDNALDEFKKALDLLPNAPVTEDRRQEYRQLFHDANFLAARRDFDARQLTEAWQRVRQSWSDRLAYKFERTLKKPIDEIKISVRVLKLLPLFGISTFVGIILGLIRLRRKKWIAWLEWTAPFVIPVGVLIFTFVPVWSGYFQLEESMRSMVGGVFMLALLFGAAISVPFVVGKIIGQRIPLPGLVVRS